MKALWKKSFIELGKKEKKGVAGFGLCMDEDYD